MRSGVTEQIDSVRFGDERAGRRRNAARIAMFVEEYVRTLNAAHAARAAGYAAKASAVRGAELLRRADVRESIGRRQEELARRYEANTENTIEALASTAFFDPIDFFYKNGALRDIASVPKRTRQALAGFKVRRIKGRNGEPDEEIIEIRFLDRGANIERLMKHLGLFEKDNRQKPDAVAELLAHIAEHGAPLAVRQEHAGQ